MQLEKPPPSSSHSKVEPPCVEENVNVAPVAFVGSFGVEPMDVFGGVVSTVHVNWAGEASVLPATSVARTLKVWLSSERPA